jgi:hypothetical protein
MDYFCVQILTTFHLFMKTFLKFINQRRSLGQLHLKDLYFLLVFFEERLALAVLLLHTLQENLSLVVRLLNLREFLCFYFIVCEE